jgi:hypothetical protein
MDRGRLPFVDRPLPPSLERRELAVPVGAARAYDPALWRDALVVVERGEIELECRGGSSRRFKRGDVLWLAGLPVRALRNRGPERTVLVAVSRRLAAKPEGGRRRAPAR